MFLTRSRQPSPVRGSSLVAASGVILLLGVGIGTLIGPALSNPAALRTVADAAVKMAPAEDGRPTRAAYPAQVLHVNDGDTFEARVSVWPGLEITTKVRLRGIDAPELRSRCADELAKAQAALRFWQYCPRARSACRRSRSTNMAGGSWPRRQPAKPRMFRRR